MATHTYVCRSCHKNFVRERAYMDHECTRMKKEKELKSVNGQTAWYYYQKWMMEKKRMPPSAEAFMDSKLFRTFMNFTAFVKKTNLPLPNKFIWFMVKKEYPPTMWMTDEVYSQYLSFIDLKMPPVEQAKSSINTILDYADALDIDPSEVFNNLNPNELIHLVRIRKLSPWLLIFSGQFKKLFASFNEEQQSILETLIKPETWDDKMSKNKVEIETIKKYVMELGI